MKSNIYEHNIHLDDSREIQRKHSPEDLLQRATLGDLTAAVEVFNYLTAGLQDLRHIMHAAIHSFPDAHLWRCFLTYYAVGEWGEWDPFGDSDSPRARRLSWKEPVAGSISMVITELFITDLDDAEGKRKQLVLHRALFGMGPLRNAAACLLGLRRDIDALPYLEDMLCGGGNPAMGANDAWQMRAIDALGAIGDKSCGPALLCALASGPGQIHRAAARALRELGSAAEDVLLLALLHPDSHIRWHAAHGLGQIGDLRGIDILVEGLHDEHPAVRWATATVLAKLDSPAIPFILRDLVQRKMDEPYRQAAYHALHGMAAYSARSYLQELLEVLRSATAGYQAPVLAQRMLSQWNPAETEKHIRIELPPISEQAAPHRTQ